MTPARKHPFLTEELSIASLAFHVLCLAIEISPQFLLSLDKAVPDFFS